MRRLKSWFAGSAVWAVASGALAWSGEPLCTLRVPGTAAEDRECTAAVLDAAAPPALPAPAGGYLEPISPVQARFALEQAEEALAEGEPADAILQLRVVEQGMPLVGDRLALRRAEALSDVGLYAQACEAYARAAESENRDVAVRGRVGAVRCLLDAGERAGEERLRVLVSRYPHLSDRVELRLALARAKERWGERMGAIAILRTIDLQYPASKEATEARRELERLSAEGLRVAPYSPEERYERAQRLFRNAPTEVVEAELAALFAEKRLSTELRARAHLLAARLAREQGLWDTVRSEVEEARRNGASVADATKLLPSPATAPVPEDTAKAEREIERRIQSIARGRKYTSLSNVQLQHLLDLAVRYDRVEIADGVLGAMRGRERYTPSMRYDAALRAVGVASDPVLADLLASVVDSGQLRVAGGYHYARALERTGRFGEAEAQYLEVIALDRSETGWYAMWSEQRLWAMRSEASAFCAPPPAEPEAAIAEIDAMLAQGEPVPLAELFDIDAASADDPDEGLVAETASALDDAAADPLVEVDRGAEVPAVADRDAILATLAPIAEAHGAAYPWLRRARDLVALGLLEDASDELHEAFLAWRDAKGSPRMRVGLEAVFTGNAPARYPADHATRRARLELDAPAREGLAEAARLLGDPGTSLGFGARPHGARPRAYAEAVEHAARKHGLDPNLLFAVMRVESVFHRRIVSYAGAVGLMQIMPRTGRRIAQRLGVDEFEVTDLLDPELNLEFSAWYLASLLERFDGSLPLAIASYNGGPQNVRVWMRERSADMPLDTFLEHIPFTQTHRYVRRVLTHYAAYRAQQHLPMARLDVGLPRSGPDRLAF